jgi:hypothetical protein
MRQREELESNLQRHYGKLVSQTGTRDSFIHPQQALHR